MQEKARAGASRAGFRMAWVDKGRAGARSRIGYFTAMRCGRLVSSFGMRMVSTPAL